MNPIRIVLADDHPLYRTGLRATLSATEGMTIVAEAGNGQTAISLIREYRPDVAILDLEMPELDGIAVAQQIYDLVLPVAVVILTGHRSELLLNRALDAGAKGFLLKESVSVDVVRCVRAVNSGQTYISPELASFLLSRKDRAVALAAEKTGLKALTPSERRILALIAAEKTSTEIAAALFVSARTIDHHRANICAKLDLHGYNALVKFAASHRSEL